MSFLSRSRRSRTRSAAIVAAMVSFTLLAPTAPAFATAVVPDTATVNVTKSNDLGGDPLAAGDDVTYNIYLSCSSIEVDCVNFTFVDVLPAELELDRDSLPSSTATRTVTFDDTTRALSIAYHQRLDNPVGTGLIAGMNETFDIKMTLPSTTPLPHGASISNSATVDADNADPKTAANDIVVSVPRVVTPVATKKWTGSSAVAGSGAVSTVQLGIRNASSGAADVRGLSITDRGQATFDRFDLDDVRLVSFPPGADIASLFVCTDEAFACADSSFIAGGTLTSTGSFALPTGVDATSVTAIRVEFTAQDGAGIPISATEGRVDLDLALRATIRSTGVDQKPTDRVTVSNCATPSATGPNGDRATGTAVCASKDVVPDVLVLTASKTFFADTNQNFTRDNGEYSVVGRQSAVSAIVQARNDSPFAVSELTFAEPSTTTPAEFDKFDTNVVRLTFPAGAESARLVISYSDGTSSDDTYSASTVLRDIERSGARVTGVTVTYLGVDGQATIEPRATAQLGLSGHLNLRVTNDDLPGGTSPGVDNCARVTGSAGRADGTGAATANACNTLPVESPRSSGVGVKNVERSSIPIGEPIPFTLRYTNNGNLPLTTAVISDPPTDSEDKPMSGSNPFAVLRITGATVSKTAGTDAAQIQVFDPAADEWVAFVSTNAALLERATGIRATLAGQLNPTQYFQLNLTTERRSSTPDGVTLSNCFVMSADGYVGSQPACSPSITTGPASDGATVNKSISPSVLPRHVPGLPTQYASVNLSIRNTGNLSARELGVEDADEQFFDSVDFAGFTSLAFPASSHTGNRVRIDVLVDDAWVTGLPASAATLPGGVDAEDVRGIRAVVSSTSTVNGGHVFTPCTSDNCEGKITFRVTPREHLRSDGSAVTSPLTNSATGLYSTRLQVPGESEVTDTVTSDLALNSGSPKLDVDKTPNASIAPGESVPFTLKVTNTGTSNIPNLRVIDALPNGLAFDEDQVGDSGLPFRVTAVDVPAGTPAVPTPAFALERDGDHVSRATFDFGNWIFAPGATLSIVVHAKLEPGVLAEQSLVNTMAAGSTIPSLACESGDGVTTDGAYGDGTYCTDTATARTRAGASFEARKWVAGNPDLGWYNSRSAVPVAIGDDSCPAFTENGTTYTATPCIALVNPGDTFDYLVRIRNAGTEPGTQMTIVDRFPANGDTGVLGASRGTQWDNRPSLVAAPVVVGGGSNLELGYSTRTALCTEDLDLGTSAECAPGDWVPGFSRDATAFQAKMNFRQAPLAPGDGVSITFSMLTPMTVTRVSDPTIAWNSVAHSETTQQQNGRDRVLAPIEPIKVGVATSYGALELEKTLGANPAPVNTAGVVNTFAYECAITPRGEERFVVAEGTADLEIDEKSMVRAIPAGAACDVWETEANGAVSDHDSRDNSARVVIAPHFGTGQPDPSTIPTASIENSYPLGVLRVTKTVTGEAAAYGVGPFSVEVMCEYNDEIVAGFPKRLTFTGSGSKDVAAPVGALCTTSEPDSGGATRAVIAPESPVVIPTNDTDGVYVAAVTVANTFDAGSLVINKQLSGVGVTANPDRTYVFDVTCSFNGVDRVFQEEISLSAREGDLVLTSAPIRDLPIGAICAITEIDNGGADSTPPPVTLQIIADEDTDNTAIAGFVNEYSAGVVDLNKSVEGVLAEEPFVLDSVFVVEVTCELTMTDADGNEVRATLLNSSFDIRAGQTSRLSGVILPVGARCFGVETDSGSATASMVTPASFEEATPVASGSPDELQVLQINALNTFDAATVSVTKRVVHGVDAATVYRFELQCSTTDDAGQTRIVPAEGSDTTAFGLRADETRTFTVVAGSTCAIVETDVPAGASVAYLDDDTGSSVTDGMVVATSKHAITVTNTFPAPVVAPSSLSVTGLDNLDTLGRLALFLLLTGALLLLTYRVLKRSRATD